MRRLILVISFFTILLPLRALAEETAAPSAGSAEEKASHTARPKTAASNPLLHDLDALFLLQDATARGRRDAAALQKPLLVSIGERLSKVKLDDLDGMAPYIAGYVLSGGDPRPAETLAKSDQLPTGDRRLLEGVALFMQGDREKAATLLGNIDTSALPARIAGRVALARALLESDPVARQNGLSAAIASMPGTLVEESALRRSALAFAEASNQPSFWKRLERYQRRFPDSLYARTFWEEMMGEILKMSSKGKAPDLDRLDQILQTMPEPQQRDLYLLLARQASGTNNIPLVEFAAGRVRGLADTGSGEEQSARLYLALYAVASSTGGQALADLEAINRSLLDEREQALLDAAIWIGQQIRQPAKRSQISTRDAGEPKSPLESRAENLLAEVEKLLAESST